MSSDVNAICDRPSCRRAIEQALGAKFNEGTDAALTTIGTTFKLPPNSKGRHTYMTVIEGIANLLPDAGKMGDP